MAGMMPDTQQARWQNDPWKQNEDFSDAKESIGPTEGEQLASGGLKTAATAVTAANPILGGAMMLGSMLLDNMMKAKQQRTAMQSQHYQNQLSTISGGVNQYAQGTRTVNQDMLQSMRSLA